MPDQPTPLKVELVFAGVGSAFALENWQSNMLLEITTADHDGVRPKRLLIDCGGDIRHALHHVLGLRLPDIDAVYVSHAHADHIGGLEGLALMTKFGPTAYRRRMYVNRRLASDLWTALKPGCNTVQNEKVSLDSFFEVCRLPESGSFTFGGVHFETLRSIHTMADRDLNPSYGLRFVAPDGKKVLMPTDTQHAPAQLDDFYRDADVILQDCETMPFKSGVHAHYTELLTLPEDIRARMWLYHYQDGDKPDAEADGFAGWATQGQRFTWAASPARVGAEEV